MSVIIGEPIGKFSSNSHVASFPNQLPEALEIGNATRRAATAPILLNATTINSITTFHWQDSAEVGIPEEKYEVRCFVSQPSKCDVKSKQLWSKQTPRGIQTVELTIPSYISYCYVMAIASLNATCSNLWTKPPEPPQAPAIRFMYGTVPILGAFLWPTTNNVNYSISCVLPGEKADGGVRWFGTSINMNIALSPKTLYHCYAIAESEGELSQLLPPI
jgi:hypothetical protein